MIDPDVVGCTGTVTVAIRGGADPGQVHVGVRGGSEEFIAYSSTPLERGAQILVIDTTGPRSVAVTRWDPVLTAGTFGR